MRVIDMLVHPLAKAGEDDLFDLSGIDWNQRLAALQADMDRCHVAASGVCVMDERMLDRPDPLEALGAADASGRFWFTLVPDLRREDAVDRVRQAAAAGFRGLTLHSYLQQIADRDFPAVVRLVRQASDLGMFVGLCTAHGSKHIYEYHSLPLAAEVAKAVSGPVILYHAGGYKITEVLALCDMWPNLFIETSFSLSYWMGSSVETDLAFALKKLGASRFMFGSDSPFMALETALRDHQEFFKRHGISPEDQALVLGGAAHRVFPFLKP
jgi:predicted TIM-barrel fold metal-dependent hydrolase